MNIAIIDDEQVFSEKLQTLIKNICDHNGIPYKIKIYQDGTRIIEKFKSFHVAFLDVLFFPRLCNHNNEPKYDLQPRRRNEAHDQHRYEAAYL